MGSLAFKLILFFSVGLLWIFHPMLIHGFGWTPGDLGDAWFNQYLLEHSFRAFGGAGGLVPGSSFWNAPFYFSTQNVHAFSDVLLGAMPFYGLWRILGLSPGVSYLLWIVSVCLLNFGAFFLFLRRVFNFEVLAACIGAFVFAFGAPRIAQMGHPQLLPQFYTVFSLLFFSEFAKASSARAWFFLILSAICYAAQFYSGFYLAWFFTMGAILFSMVSFFVRPLREKLFSLIKASWGKILISKILLVVLVFPLLQHYFAVSREYGLRSWQETMWMVPPLQAWVYQGPDVFIHFWMKWVKFFQVISHEYEQRLGIGILTTVLAASGFIRSRKNAIQLALFISFFIFAVVITKYPPRADTLWNYFYSFLPGAGAIRVPSRIVMLFLIPAGVGVAQYFSLRKNDLKKAVFLTFVICVVLEQGASMVGFQKSDAEARVEQVVQKYREQFQSPGHEQVCKTFFYSPGVTVARGSDGREGYPSHAQIAAMWASLELKIPTVNGYSGRNPGGAWSQLNDPAVINADDEKRIRRALVDYAQSKAIDLRELCWIRG